MAVIPVSIADAPYEVRIEAGLISRAGENCRPFIRKDHVAIVTDENVAASWRDAVTASFAKVGLRTEWLVLPAGEGTKSWEHLASVVDWMLAREIERKDNVVALGGGVIGDLTGFAASMVKRGCGFIQIPTTLLAQVDSSVGGKTAINTPAGKNLVGAFHQPSLVLADPLALDTLPPRDTRAGYAEVVKYGLIDNAPFFEWCEANGARLLAGDSEARELAIASSVAAKARIVAADEKETAGIRALLNLGHTFGHALEAETGFSDRLLHGEGVALGMALAARFSARQGLMTSQDAQRVVAHLAAVGLPSKLIDLGLDCNGRRLADHMLHDKKMDAGTLPFLLMRGIGQTFLAKNVDLADVAAFLDEELSR
ncbi:3-dehydroquinate synthase [Novosphingobium taihuense]|uniref:3-dehydroquinate synthase n=1 Tax=Novosphingobium taihuense TaxID=260085 RepID=A0A7W7ACU2_9SPHN|nr:3-dehydroquinate synthase [Novosphingobium taihuense]MBB4613797.1 3-dehydroquinate synthase [Novosphingobium taihuense]TWH83306.1 3-dehydroquinate synthase [Novosphingobium taihuense]